MSDIREEIELCNRYYLLHNFPQFGTWGLFFAYTHTLVEAIRYISQGNDRDRLQVVIAIATVIQTMSDIREEIELCNRYYLLHNFPQFGTWGLFFAHTLVEPIYESDAFLLRCLPKKCIPRQNVKRVNSSFFKPNSDSYSNRSW